MQRKLPVAVIDFSCQDNRAELTANEREIMRVREYSIVSSTISNGIPLEVRYRVTDRVETILFDHAIQVSNPRETRWVTFYWVDLKGRPHMAIVLKSAEKIVLVQLEEACHDLQEMQDAEESLVKNLGLDKPRA